MKINREIGDRLGQGNALGNLGDSYLKLGEINKSITFTEQCLGNAREIGDRAGEGSALNNLGEAYRNLGKFEQARIFGQQALEIFKEIESPKAEETRKWLESL